MKTTIPFSGFYYSMWDVALDAENECREDPAPNVDWAKVRFFIARDYTRHLADDLGVKLDFEKVSSPREYNFETDKIVVEIHEDDVARLYRISRDNKHAELARLIEERCTSRSGFISFYSNDINDWLVDGWITWTSAQLSLLVEAAANIREVSEEEIFEYMQCNGEISEAFWGGVVK